MTGQAAGQIAWRTVFGLTHRYIVGKSEFSRMAQVTEERVLAALRSVIDPDREADLVSLGMIAGLVIKDGNVGFAIEVDPQRGPQLEPLRKAAEKAVEALPEVLSVTAVLTAHSARGAEPPPGPQQRPAPGGPLGERPMVPGIKSIVAVASGKGGVGKSTTAVNLALGLAAGGRRVGMFDADIYGPSQPRMMGITGRPISRDGQTLEPMQNFGVKVMSMGFLVAEETPMIWRGPMVMSALQQMLRDVNWGELDIMIVDLPPGTGDAQLTMAQQVPLSGAVIVSTPQDIALLDARKGLNMFRQVDVPVLGIIENMSYFVCPHCGHDTPIFGHGGARREAERLGTEFLGEIALDIEIRETSDSDPRDLRQRPADRRLPPRQRTRPQLPGDRRPDLGKGRPGTRRAGSQAAEHRDAVRPRRGGAVAAVDLCHCRRRRRRLSLRQSRRPVRGPVAVRYLRGVMRKSRTSSLSVALLAGACLVAGVLPAAGQTGWEQDLAEQMIDEFDCRVAYFTNVVEREVDGQRTVFAKVHCEDKRAYDAVLDPSDPFFQIRECELDAC
jgi:ATP-binding protein involved in chromosome partitioning